MKHGFEIDYETVLLPNRQTEIKEVVETRPGEYIIRCKESRSESGNVFRYLNNSV